MFKTRNSAIADKPARQLVVLRSKENNKFKKKIESGTVGCELQNS